MRFARIAVGVSVFLTLSFFCAIHANAIDRGILIKEPPEPNDASQPTGCSLAPYPWEDGVYPRDGTCANYRWFNLCTGYLWLYDTGAGEGSSVQFGGPEQPCVSGGNIVKRAITYFYYTLPGYGQTVDITIDADDGDGCPDATLAADLDVDPAWRWNCSEFDVVLPAATSYVLVRAINDGWWAPYHATDMWRGEFGCPPEGISHSFGYYSWAPPCVRWSDLVGARENFRYWLILDGAPPNATKNMSWGAVKGLFR